MGAEVFADKRRKPSDADVAEVLGPAKRHWDALLADARKLDGSVVAEWKYYASKREWTYVVRDKRRNLLYLKPGARGFLAALAIGDEALKAAKEAGLPADVVKAIEEAPKYPEGRPARIEVTSASVLRVVRKLLAVKMTS